MKQVLFKQGQVVSEEIPAPKAEAGSVLVRVSHSCISIGTEMSGLNESEAPLWKRALKNPAKVKKVFQLVKDEGLNRTKEIVQGKLSEGSPTGYSAAGTILEVGKGIDDLRPGDRVACSGAQYANHCEVICVPRNLTVPIPRKLNYPEACTVTLGAIALQGIRRANPTLGETICVIGLGILGQLTVQMLKANGCKVIGSDLDSNRIKFALMLGMDEAIYPGEKEDVEKIHRLTNGHGADGIIITAASPSNEIVSTAFKMCRKKGRVVLVGDVGLNLNREDIYKKELDFFISTSYGPGRYDHQYEEKGLDYPLSYIRWTENRNMGEYLRLLEEEKVKVTPLISKIFTIEKASVAYSELKSNGNRPLMVLLSYPQPLNKTKINRVVSNPFAPPSKSNQIKMALVGAGNFAKGIHLPNLKSFSDDFHLQAVMSRTGHNASNTAKQFGANYATTDYYKIIQDHEIDAVLICTRHNLHTDMVLEALKAGKHVLVEKPLALNQRGLDKILDFYSEEKSINPPPILLTGFNRRFSPFAQKLSALLAKRTNPMILNYRMNGGYIPLDHWIHLEEGGGRNLGEACHIYDLFTFFTDSKVLKVEVQSIIPKTSYYSNQDNFIATMTFEDGSIGTLTYTALGSKEYPKETMEVFVDGKVFYLNDYKTLTLSGIKAPIVATKLIDKGQKSELKAFGKAIIQGGEWPIPLWQQMQASEIAIKVQSELG